MAKRHGRVAWLSKIFSENSEDAQTWSHFSHLLSMSPKTKRGWLKAFLHEALERSPKEDLARILLNPELGFWRRKKEDPLYIPLPNLGCEEGKHGCDLTILGKRAIIFVETKYHSEIEMRTTHLQIEIR